MTDTFILGAGITQHNLDEITDQEYRVAAGHDVAKVAQHIDANNAERTRLTDFIRDNLARWAWSRPRK